MAAPEPPLTKLYTGLILGAGDQLGAFFIFIFFENIFYRNIFSISQFTVLYPYCPAGGRQGACRPAAGRQGLIYKFKKNYLRGSPWQEPAAPLAGGRGPAARQGGGRLPTPV